MILNVLLFAGALFGVVWTAFDFIKGKRNAVCHSAGIPEENFRKDIRIQNGKQNNRKNRQTNMRAGDLFCNVHTGASVSNQ